MDQYDSEDAYVNDVSDADFYGTAVLWTVIGLAGIGIYIAALKHFLLLF